MPQRTEETVQMPLRSLWLRSRNTTTHLLYLICLGGITGISIPAFAQAETSDTVVVPIKELNSLTDSKVNTAASVPTNNTTANERLKQKLAPARIPASRTRHVVSPKRPGGALNTTKSNQNTLTAADYNGAFIDPTDYSIGATKRSRTPRVVGAKRCSSCNTMPRRRIRIANSSTSSINRLRLPRRQVTNIVATRSLSVRRRMTPVVSLGAVSVTNRGLRAAQSTPATLPLASSKLLAANRRIYDNSAQINKQPKANQLLFPLTIPAPITSLFGWRLHPITGDRRFHAGTDLGAPLGTPVVAAYAGNVAIADYLGGYGLTVVLEHNYPHPAVLATTPPQQTLYGHLSEIFVQPGDRVEQGTVIGRVGSTGNSTGPHLHFETRHLTPDGWVATDPGLQLEYAITQLVDSLRTARSSQKPGA